MCIFTSSAYSSGLVPEYVSVLILSPYSIHFIHSAYFPHEYLHFKSFLFLSNKLFTIQHHFSPLVYSHIEYLHQYVSSSLIIFFHSKYFPFTSISPATIFFKICIYLKYIILQNISFSLVVFPGIYPAINFSTKQFPPQTYSLPRYSFNVIISPPPIAFNDFLQQYFISLATYSSLPENIYLLWVCCFHFPSVVSRWDYPPSYSPSLNPYFSVPSITSTKIFSKTIPPRIFLFGIFFLRHYLSFSSYLYWFPPKVFTFSYQLFCSSREYVSFLDLFISWLSFFNNLKPLQRRFYHSEYFPSKKLRYTILLLSLLWSNYFAAVYT